jgi:hypothetical protein
VFNWSEVHLPEVTSYKIHTLADRQIYNYNFFSSLSVGSMPFLLTLSCAVLLLLTLVFVFIEFGEKSSCCGQYRFLTFFNLFIIAPVVTWMAMVVFPLGIPDEKPNLFNPSIMGWLRIGGISYNNQYSKLKCDPVFWKGTFWFVCLLCAFEVGIIVAIFLKFCKVTCRCLKICCCCCCENENSDPENHQAYALSQIVTSENAENTLLIVDNQESNNQVQESQTSNETPFEDENLLPKVTKKELKKLTKDKKKAEEKAKREAEAKAKAVENEKEDVTVEKKDEEEVKAKVDAEEQAKLEAEKSQVRKQFQSRLV